jgi:hypothetical protein
MVLLIVLVFYFLYPDSFKYEKKNIKRVKKRSDSYFFELVDYFYYSDDNNEYDFNDLYLVLRNLDNNKLYCISKEVYYSPYDIPREKNPRININAYEKTIWKDNNKIKFKKEVYLSHCSTGRIIKIKDSGMFWIDNNNSNCYLNAIKNKKKLSKIYKGNINEYIESRNNVSEYSPYKILLNANKKYNYEILKECTFITGIVKFDE